MDSTPSKRRKLSSTTSVPVDASHTSLSAGRASYMSPTKSSLSRFNPNILSKATGFTSRRDSEGQRSSSPRKLNPTALRTGSTRLSASPTRGPSSSPTRQPQIGGGLSAPPRRRSRTPGDSIPVTAPIDPQSAPVPEASVAADGVELDRSLIEEEKLGQMIRRSARSTRGNRLSWVKAQEEQAGEQEPQLPPTPEQLGLEPRPEKPKGLSSSSPSKRTEKNRKNGVGVGSSPLKAKDDGQEKDVREEGGDAETQEKRQDTGVEMSETQDEEDPELVSRRELLEQLSVQLASLQKDVSVLEAEVRRSQSTARGDPDGDVSPDRLISILTSTNLSNAPLPPPPRPPSLTSRLALFLPFSKRPTPQQEAPQEVPQEEDQPHILSHRPLDLPDAIPHLCAFTPFTITSTDTLILPPRSRSDTPIRQQRDVTLEAHKSLLSIKLRLISNTRDETMDSISLLDISPWADTELGHWIRKQAPSCDAGSIGWSCNQYLDVSNERSRCWADCRGRWPHLLRHRGQAPEDSISSTDLPRTGDADPSLHAPLAYNGRQSLLFSDDRAHLLVSWRIDFDWIGDAQSDIWVEAAYPKAWTRVDERGSLGKLTEAFELLVRRVGVFKAVGAVVGIVFGKGEEDSGEE